MSLGSDQPNDRRSSPLLATRPKLRLLVLASAALVTWLCLDTWLDLISSRYPIGLNPQEPTEIGFAIGWALALSAVAIVLIVDSWRQARILVSFLALSTVVLFASVAVSRRFSESSWSDDLMNASTAMVGALILVIVALVYAASSDSPVLDRLRLDLPKRRAAIAFVLPLVGWLALSILWQFTPFNPVIHPDAPDHIEKIHQALFNNPFVTLAYIAVLIPMGEELVFRGLIATYLRDAANIAVAVFVSTAVFAVFHIDPQYFSINQVLYVFCMGAILATSLFATKSIWPGTLVHAVNNAWVTSVSISA